MLNVIVDSGATKSEFVIFDKDKHDYFYDIGINANYASNEEISSVFSRFFEYLHNHFSAPVQSIVYYGAGCMNLDNCKKITAIIKNQFIDTEVFVYSDLLLPCHVLANDKNAIVAILGSGSAACLYKNKQIEKIAPSCGYLLGDDGSGTELGKSFLKSLLLNKISPELKAQFEEFIKLTTSQIIPHIYSLTNPQRFFSSIPLFLSQNIDNEDIAILCKKSFSLFFEHQLDFFQDDCKYPWMFSGSIAYHFRQPLFEVAKSWNIEIEKIANKPLEQYTF